MNKKSQTATILLGVAALVFAAAAIGVMLMFSNNFNSQEAEINSVIYQVQFNQQYIITQSKLIGGEAVSKCPSCSVEQLKQKFKEIASQTENNFRYEGAGNFYGKIRNSEFDIVQENGKYLLKIQSLFVESESNLNKIKRNFDLNVSLN